MNQMNPTPKTSKPLLDRVEAVLTLGGMACFGLLGMLWTGVALPETSRQIFGTLLAADLARAAFFGIGLAVCLGRVFLWKGHGPWRSATVALAVACGEGLVGGLTLALNRALPWSTLTPWVQPLVTLVYALGLSRILFKRIPGLRHAGPFPWRAILFSAGLGLLAAAWWPATGALGTLEETALAVIEAAGIGLIGTLCLNLFFGEYEILPARHPVKAWLLAGIVCGVSLTPAFAVRGWSAQGTLVAIPSIFFSLAAASLFAAVRSQRADAPRWGSWAFFFLALLSPLAFTNGAEGDWLPGGLPNEANTALLISLITCLVIAVGIHWIGPTLKNWRLTAVWMNLLPVGSLVLSLILIGDFYITVGHVGLQPDTFFVVMSDQPDTSFARRVTDPSARRAAVFQALVTQAQASQAPLRSFLDSRGVHYTPYYLVNGLEVEGTPFLRDILAHRSDVARILNSPHLRPQPPLTGKIILAEARPNPSQIPWGIKAIGANRVWRELGKNSSEVIDGKGIVVGVIGTGVDWTHPDVLNSYQGSEGHHDYTWYDPWEGTATPVDTNGIGTHTLGTVVGADGIGVAPGARWIACRSLARDLGNPPLYISCMQFLLAPFPQHSNSFRDGDPARGANVVDAAWICPAWEGCDTLTLSIAIRHIADAGQMFITGAGNDGPSCNSIVSPGLSGDALTVGASGKNGLIAPSSSRGPITSDGSGRIKPDVLAPGVGIISDLPDGRYAEFNGTSMAASHVAGIVTLMWSANPALIGQIESTKQILAQTAHFNATQNSCGFGNGKQNNDYGYGIVDAYEAVKQALAQQTTH